VTQSKTDLHNDIQVDLIKSTNRPNEKKDKQI